MQNNQSSLSILRTIIEVSDEGVSLRVDNSHEDTNGFKVASLDFTSPDRLFADVEAVNLDAIVSVDLSSCNLSSLPAAFSSLRLKRLNLSCNKLTEVPESLSHGLKCLENLDLSCNAIRSFDFEPQCVLKLRILKLDYNRFLDIPKWILEMSCCNLEEFDYSHNRIASLQDNRFRINSYRLKKLFLKNCYIRDEDISVLKCIRTLNVLDVSNTHDYPNNCFRNSNFIIDLLDKPLWDDKLTVLSLNNLQISAIPEEIGILKLLEELYISQNDIWWLPASLGTLECLRILDISHNNIVGLSEIANSKTLEILYAAFNCISSLPTFSSLSLRTIDLYYNDIDEDCDVRISPAVIKVDLEKNLINTCNLNDDTYEERKRAYRLGMEVHREDGPKPPLYHSDEEELNYSDESSYSESSCNDNLQERREIGEESWSPELCENECTLSDNDWQGCEKVRMVKRRVTRTNSFADWMFEDVV